MRKTTVDERSEGGPSGPPRARGSSEVEPDRANAKPRARQDVRQNFEQVLETTKRTIVASQPPKNKGKPVGKRKEGGDLDDLKKR